jgi:tripartite-type tricarboxylate transporter receptor subunit TctC
MLTEQCTRKTGRSRSSLTLISASIAAALVSPPAAAQTASNFFAGNQISVVIGYQVGAGYDQYARLLIRHMMKRIPGAPTMIPRNMVGAGTRVAANWIYNVAPRDGSVIGVVDQNIPLDQALGDTSVNFDVRKFHWLGNMAVINNVLVVWHDAGVRTIEEAKTKEIIIGSPGGPSPALWYPLASNNILGTKFKIVPGYANATQMNLAMERGKTQGRGSSAWQTYKTMRPDWVENKKIIPLFQVGIHPDPELTNVPMFSGLAQRQEDRAALELLSAPVAVGRTIITPPGVPEERVAILRRAFDETMKDPQFIEDARRQNLDINPLSGEEVQKYVGQMVSTPRPIIERLKMAIRATH